MYRHFDKIDNERERERERIDFDGSNERARY